MVTAPWAGLVAMRRALDTDELCFVVLAGRVVVPDLDAASVGARVQRTGAVDREALEHVLHLMEGTSAPPGLGGRCRLMW